MGCLQWGCQVVFLFVPPLSRLSPSPNLVGGPGLPGLSLLTGTQVWGFSVWLILAAGRGRLTRYQQGKDIQPSLGQPTSGGGISMKRWHCCHFSVKQKSVDNFASKHYWPGCLFKIFLIDFQESKLHPVPGRPLDRRWGDRRVLVQLTSTLETSFGETCLCCAKISDSLTLDVYVFSPSLSFLLHQAVAAVGQIKDFLLLPPQSSSGGDETGIICTEL